MTATSEFSFHVKAWLLCKGLTEVCTGQGRNPVLQGPVVSQAGGISRAGEKTLTPSPH